MARSLRGEKLVAGYGANRVGSLTAPHFLNYRGNVLDLSKLKPVGDKILVKVFENSDMSDGGIFIGQATTTFVNGKEKAAQKTVGEVVAWGRGKYNKKGVRREPDVQKGDIVCFSDTCGREMDDEHLMIKEGDIAFFMDEAKTVELTYKLPGYYKHG